MKKELAILTILILTALTLSACSDAPVEQTAEPVGCQEDARMCPDGTALARLPPSCEFPECPTVEEAPMENILSEEVLEEDLNLAQGEPLDDPILQLEPGDAEAYQEEPEVHDLPETKEFTINAENWNFDPKTIEVNKGDRVILHLNGVDGIHGLALPAFDINEEIRAGQTKTIEFVADKAGEHTFYCNVPCGSGHSHMKGILVVN